MALNRHCSGVGRLHSSALDFREVRDIHLRGNITIKSVQSMHTSVARQDISHHNRYLNMPASISDGTWCRRPVTEPVPTNRYSSLHTLDKLP